MNGPTSGPDDPTVLRASTQAPPARQRAASPSDATLGIIDGRYVLESTLGGGGMGVVYRARDRLMEDAQDPDPYVALKVLSEAIRDNPAGPIALQRETRRAQALAHPGIVRVFHFGRDNDTYYMTMELLRGRSFDDLMHEQAGGIPLQQAASLIEQLCSALAYAHSQGLVHSDIKPSNIFLTPDGLVKVLDFGIAAPLREPGSAHETRFNPRHHGALSPKYSAPELWLGLDADPRDDVYSLGCVVYELLTGRHPYDGEEAPRARERRMAVRPVDALTPAQNEAIRRALSLERQGRTASVEAFRVAFLGAGTTRLPATRSRALAWALAGTLIVATAAAAYWMLNRAGETAAEDAPLGAVDSVPISPSTPARPAASEAASIVSTQDVSSAMQSPSPGPLEPEGPSNLPLASDCSDLEEKWSSRNCEERRACFIQRADDAQTSAAVAPTDLTAVYEARAQLFQRLAGVFCEDMAPQREVEYARFRQAFPQYPLY